MAAKISKKYNDSCLKVFALLGLLLEGNAAFSEVIKLFADSDDDITQKANVILNKYMNTIKIFGVEVKKVKNRYVLSHMPFSLKLGEDDLQAVALFKSAVNFLPKGKTKANILKLLKDLENLYDRDTRKLSYVLYMNKNLDLSFYFKKFEKQIEECEEYLQSSCKLEITYVNSDKEEIMICIPQEIKYLDKVVCYSVYNTLNRQICDIPMESIRNIKKLSNNTVREQTCTSVVFKLKGDLANRYNLREWEHAEGKDANGWLTVVNSGEDFDVLRARLLRYDDKCLVISPAGFRTQMINTLDEMLNNY